MMVARLNEGSNGNGNAVRARGPTLIELMGTTGIEGGPGSTTSTSTTSTSMSTSPPASNKEGEGKGERRA